MLKLTTERLSILPLDKNNLELSINDFNEMERKLGLTVTDKNIGIREKNVYKIRLKDVENNPMNYMWYTTWVIVLTTIRKVIPPSPISGDNYSNLHTTVGVKSSSRVVNNSIEGDALKERNRIVGAIMIKGYPNDNGEVIVGYAMQDDYKGKGYMTEALKVLTQWMFLNSDVKCIIADTLKDNILSHKVLKKIGMVFYKEDEECFWWKLEK